MQIISKPMMFMIAVIYGMAWIVGPLNILAAIAASSEGGNPLSYGSTIALSFMVIFFVHFWRGWFPFQRRRP